MFGFGKKSKQSKILATQTGKIIPLNEVPDEAFAEKMLGDGIAILPEDGKIYSFTGNHKLMTKDKEWKRVDELTEDDEILSF